MLKRFLIGGIVAWFAVTSASAQTTCQALIETALTATQATCGTLAVNQACIGHGTVSATGQQGDIAFQSVGDVVDVAQIGTLSLASDSETLSVVQLHLQANYRDNATQAVTVLLFGNLTITNQVIADVERDLTASGSVNVRATPSTSGDIMKSLKRGETVLATGRLANGEWIRVQVPEDARGQGWVSAQFLQGDSDALNVVDPTAIALKPMQAFAVTPNTEEAFCIGEGDGFLIQTPTGGRIARLFVNDIALNIGSTAFVYPLVLTQKIADSMEALIVEALASDGTPEELRDYITRLQQSQRVVRATAFIANVGGWAIERSLVLAIRTLEGRVQVQSQEVSQIVPAGTETLIAINLDEPETPASAPSYPVPYETVLVETVPVETLPEVVSIAPPLAPEAVETAIEAVEEEVETAIAQQEAQDSGQVSADVGRRVVAIESGAGSFSAMRGCQPLAPQADPPDSGYMMVGCVPLGTAGTVLSGPAVDLQNIPGSTLSITVYEVTWDNGMSGWLSFSGFAFTD